jgi:hypothetical protein
MAFSFTFATLANAGWLKAGSFAIIKAHKTNGFARCDVFSNHGSAAVLVAFPQML